VHRFRGEERGVTSERLRLGTELVLERRFVPVQRAGIAPGIPRFRPRGASQASGALPAVPEEYKFAARDATLELTDEALAQLHVVFGGPGSGKSYFFMRLLEQLDDPARWVEPWGGLILDPKGTLARRVVAELGGSKITVIGGPRSKPINLLRTHLGPHDLGVALALAAQAAGVGGSEPFWVNQLKLLFGAGLAALELRGQPLTLNALATMLLTNIPVAPNPARGINRATESPMLSNEVDRLKALVPSDDATRRRRDRVLSVLAPFASAKGDNTDTVRAFIQQVLSPFLDPDLDPLSYGDATDSVADLIFRDGQWIVLELPRTSLSTSKFVATLVKVLFQQAALARQTIYPTHGRRVFMMIDEYAELATDLPGEGFGDSIFFSQMREFKVLALIATQGASMLKNSAIREAWETILTNSSSKMIFKINDPDTAELASKQVGERDFLAFEGSAQRNNDGAGTSSSQRIERKGEFASGLFLGALERGQFAFLGSADAVTRPIVKFAKVT
jgi:hypothetical protein